MGTKRDNLTESGFRRSLAAMQKYGQPLTQNGIAEEAGIPARAVPIRKMYDAGLIEVAGEIGGYLAWKLTNQKEQA